MCVCVCVCVSVCVCASHRNPPRQVAEPGGMAGEGQMRLLALCAVLSRLVLKLSERGPKVPLTPRAGGPSSPLSALRFAQKDSVFCNCHKRDTAPLLRVVTVFFPEQRFTRTSGPIKDASDHADPRLEVLLSRLSAREKRGGG
jgi:hypothetical protein